MSKATTWYDYGFTEPQGPIPNKNVSGYLVRDFVRFARHRLNLHVSVTHAPADRGIVLFSRTKNRFILNEDELVRSLQREYQRNVTILRMETHSFREQLEVLGRTGVAIGLHGSVLIMSMFLPPGAILVELFPFAVPPENYTPYKTLVNLRGECVCESACA
jgi:protein O-mannose beta-1,4-N-acetylglucosaminyltransferase